MERYNMRYIVGAEDFHKEFDAINNRTAVLYAEDFCKLRGAKLAYLVNSSTLDVLVDN